MRENENCPIGTKTGFINDTFYNATQEVQKHSEFEYSQIVETPLRLFIGQFRP
jgi:hypothetical protein